MGRVLVSDVHVTDKTGNVVVLATGSELPDWAEKLVTNPAAFGDDVATAPTPAPTPAPAAVEPTDEEVAAKVEAERLAAEADVARLAAEAAAQGSGDKTAVEAYGELQFPALQALAKGRGLSGAGNAATLIARLEADDRDTAAKAAEAAAGN